MKKLIAVFLLIGVCFGAMAAPELIEKTYEGKISEVTREVKGKKLTAFYIVVDKKKIRLPKAKADLDVSKYKDKTVTVVVKGTNKKVKSKKTKKETTRFIPKEIVSIQETGDDDKE